jgi:hypothetical protein
MISYTLDAGCIPDETDARLAASLPDPGIVPPEDANI